MKKFGAWLLTAMLALVGVSGVAEEVQQPTQTADWFSAGFDGTDGKWTIPTGAATFELGKLLIDTDIQDTAHQEVVYTPATIGKSSDKVTIKTAVEMPPLTALPEASSLHAQAAFTLLKDGEGLAYYGLTKVNDVAAWVELTGVAPVEDVAATVSVEFDYSAKTVTYKVGGTALSYGSTTALPLADATPTTVSSISYVGSGVASLLEGDYLDADRKFAVVNAQGGYTYYATEAEVQAAVGEGGAYFAFNSTGGWESKAAPLFVAEVFGSEGASKGKAASLTAAVGMAAAGDVIKVIRAVSDETVTVDKSVTITSDLETKPVLNNVSITGNGAEIEFAVKNLKFTGNSWINANNVCALTVDGVEAHVKPNSRSLTNSRAAFVCLGKTESPALLLTVKNCIIDAANAQAADATFDKYSGAIIGWRFIADGSEISGNTLGTVENPYRWIAIKLMDFMDGATVKISENTIYGTNESYDFQAIDLYQNNSRANTYTVISLNNTINVAKPSEDYAVLAFELECNTMGTTPVVYDGHCIFFDNGTTINGVPVTFNDVQEEYQISVNEMGRAKNNGETPRAAVCLGINVELDANGKLTAGLVSDNVPALFAEGYEAVAQGTTPETWAVQEKANPVTICVSSEGVDDDGDGTAEKPFATLAKAVATAKSGDTVKLLTDLPGNFALSEAKDLSLDLGDKTLTGSVTVSAGSLVLSGAGTITGTVTGATVADGFLMSKYRQATGVTEYSLTDPVYRVMAEDDVAVRLTDTTENVYYFKSLGEASCSFVRGGSPYAGAITITMLKSNHGGGLCFEQKDTTVTVDFGGFTYTVDSDQLAGSDGTTTQAAQILKRITMTFKNGTLVADHPQIKDMIRSYAANMTFDNMVIDGTKMTDPRMTVVCLNGEMHLKNGTKVLAAADTPALSAEYYASYKAGLLYVDDNTVEISGSLTYDRDSGTIATMLETVKHIKPADYPFELAIPDECEWVDYTDGKKFLDYKKVAQITVSDVTTKYYTLEDAVAAAGDDDVTIVVIGDTTKLTEPEGWEFKTDSETGITTLVKKAAAVCQIVETGVTYPTLQEAVAAVPTDGTLTTIKMIANEAFAGAEGKVAIASTKNVVLDLNGCTLSYTTEGYGAFISNNGTLEITDTSDDKLGKITAKFANPDWMNGCYTVDNGNDTNGKAVAKLTITAGTIENTSSAGLAWPINNGSWNSNAETTINGGTIHSVNYVPVRQYLHYAGSKKLVINGGTFISDNSRAVAVQFNDASVQESEASVIINGGDFSCNGTGIFYMDLHAANVDTTGLHYEVNGGKFRNTNTSAPVVVYDDEGYSQTTARLVTKFITGGIYSTEPDATYIAEGYKAESNPDEETKEAYPWKVQEPTVDEPIEIDITEKPVAGEPDVKVPITVTQELVKEILGKEASTLTETEKEQVVKKLQTKGDDGMTGWQKYTAGFSQTDKHPLAPKGKGTDDGKLVLVTSLIAPKQLSVDTGVKVKYILMQGDKSTVDQTTGLPTAWTKVQELPTPEFPVDVTQLDPETYWKIDVEYTATRVVETQVNPEEGK